jgi:crotonobetainyl-CoA:carnitine CoA-transferase CaiB-like acyl-CoA transferase
MTTRSDLPLAGIRVVERSASVAAAAAGRLLATMGADCVLAEPPEGSALRREPPLVGGGVSALFAYLAAGKRSVVVRDDEALHGLLRDADILVEDARMDAGALRARHPMLVHAAVLPFGAEGPKSDWRGEEVTAIHASGEGYLLPNGLSVERFPDRPPLKIAGHFAGWQAGVAAALGALSALWARPALGHGQFVDVSVQEAALAVGAFAIQRLGDGEVEHRVRRSFRFGGVLECADGHVELLTLEERQWQGLITLMGDPDWAKDPALADPVARSARGPEINRHIRAWAATHAVEELVARAQKLGVPMARYNAPADILAGPHEAARGIFAKADVPGLGETPVFTAPFRFGPDPLPLRGGPPALGADQALLGAMEVG